MKFIKGLLMTKIFLVLLLLFYSLPALAQTPVVSANGFSCRKKNQVVDCLGTVPGLPKVELGAIGNDIVIVNVSNKGDVWQYYSNSGCLCNAKMDKQGLVYICTSKNNRKKELRPPIGEWCANN